ncbi:MAG: LysM peptidoglycan-binding domain-containing protein, partial [Acidimicrobiales bacterium]
IAPLYDVTVEDLIAANNLTDPNLIVAGDTLEVPQAAEPTGTNEVVQTSTGLDPATPRTHSVSGGDNLWSLATQYGVPLGALARLNGIGDDAVIRPGQVLELPQASAPSATLASTSAEQSPEVAAPNPPYVVKPGDNAWTIAKVSGIPLDALLEANGLTRKSVLSLGRELVVPSPELAGLPVDLANSTERLALMPVFDRWADRYDVPADLVKAIAWFESGWNNEKRSSANAIGIGQILGITAEWVAADMIGETLDPTIAEDNIRLSTRYLRYLMDNTDSARLAVASYYQGLTATRQHGVYPLSEFYVAGVLALREQFT